MSAQLPDPERHWPQPSRFKRGLAAGEQGQLAIWVTMPSFEIVEMLGALGVDAAIIDREHSGFDLSTAVSLIAACELGGMTPLVRPSRIDPQEVTRLLDHGAGGIVFPVVSGGEAAAAARASLAYPPAGTRGWGGRHVRGVRWVGPARQRTREYLQAADAAPASIFLIENEEGVENIEEILDRGRPDAVIFGWGDYGVCVGFDADAALQAATRVYGACRERGVGIGHDRAYAGAPEPYPGCFTMAGVDSMLISDALAAHIARLRGAEDASA